ncbi:MAG TPA: autotransporter-associated beta strand repeat-containing protein [Tepidisphaeraceae bacterium]|nr:autotransporter-associated beta strand repeat-containing protein [Tepidisphaeraceae bacterium]
MKTTTKILRTILALSGCLAATSALSQTTYVWTNQNPKQLIGSGAADFNQGTNWTIRGPAGTGGSDANGVPRPDFQDGATWGDEMLFDGQTTGPVIASQDGGSQANGGGSGQPYGLRIHLTANQTAPVTVYTLASVSGGMRMNYFAIDAGAGGFNLGSNSATTVLDIVGGVLNGQICGFTNNSATTAVINPDVRWRMGGAGSHPHIFTGSGNWIVNNHMRSANQSAIQVEKFGPGTMTWIGTNVGLQSANWGDQLGTPIIIGEGTMIWKTSDLVSAPGSGNPNIVHNGTLWKYDVQPTPGLVTGPGQVLGNISGAGPFEIHAGTLTFGGANTFSGNINLSGGELIAGSTENVGVSGPLGQGGTISFNGGTLGWSLANAFDYSSRFSTASGQVYNLDTGGASPTFATGLSSTGGTLNKLGGGTLTLAGPSTYTGPTTVAANGGLVFQGTKSGNADITVADTGTLGVFENDSQVTPNTLTLGTSTGVTLEFNNVTNHATATLAPNNLVSAGSVTINVNSGRFTLIGETFPLLKWTSGSAPATTLGFLAGAGGHLTTNGNQINVVIDNPPYIWTGLNSSIWDTLTINWVRNALPATWVNGNFALLDDSSTITNLTVTGIITPTNATINSSEPYAITNSPGNVLGGGGGLTKSGNGSLVLPGGANTYTGATTLGGGVLGINVLANGGLASDIGAASSAAGNIVFSGGTMLYAGPGTGVDRLFTVGPGGGTIDNEGFGQLAFTNTGSLGMSGNGPRSLTLTGPGFGGGDTLACNITNHPAGTALTKSGAGLWILTGTNTYAGGTTLLQGSFQVGTGGTGGALGNGDISTASGTSIDFQRSGSLLVPGSIDGGASVTVDSTGTVILANNNGYTGGTTINTGTLQVGNGGGTGSLFVNGAIVDNSLLVFNTAGSFTYQAAGIISGSGNVIFQGGGLIKAVGANSYAGWTRIDANTTLFCREGQDGALASSAITNNGTLRIVEQNTPGFTYGGPISGSGRVQIGANNVNVGVVTLTGTNTYTGNTFIGDNQLLLGDNLNPGAGAIAGNVQFVNNFTIGQDNPRTLTFSRPDDFTFGGTITTNFTSPQVNQGIVQQSGSGTLTLTANNTYGSGTVVAAGFLVIGNGGSSGSVGFGPVALNSGNPLVINRSGNLTIGDNVSGFGADVVIKGGATVTLNGTNNTYSGATTVSNGTLVVKGTNATSSTHVYVGGLAGGGTFTAGPVTLEPGTTLTANGSVAPLTIMSDFTDNASAMTFEINKLASPANDSVNVTGTLARTATGGTLTVKNLGPNTLVPGDKFTLFSQPLPNGASITVGGARATWLNNLAVDGSVTVDTLITTRPNLNFTSTTTNIQFSWSDPFNSFKLQAQTNSINVGVSTNWADYPGGAANPITVPIVKTNGTVFYRIVSIP